MSIKLSDRAFEMGLKCSLNEIACEQNLFSSRFKISNRYEFISPLMWMYSMFLHSHKKEKDSLETRAGPAVFSL